MDEKKGSSVEFNENEVKGTVDKDGMKMSFAFKYSDIAAFVKDLWAKAQEPTKEAKVHIIHGEKKDDGKVCSES